MEELSGVRKGAWSKFEDELLKACVQLYGEGKWHLVPQRAGALHNCERRWSLIAGRLPGRTSNDVKNYWNSYTRRKLHTHNKDYVVKQSTLKPHQVIKPVPLALSKTSPKLLQGTFINSSNVGVSEQGVTSSSNWWQTLLDEKGENITVNNTGFFGEEDGVFELWNQELTSIDSHFLTEAETWSDMFLDLGVN
ncbi:hypothetical protein VNO80_07989 [Phaseolus coccineus]|uniref:Uncharacterized protein n=1 Tax=Phaseolus coccineus TaxID=3886 RepID=A0AAN9NRI9_PHACN